MLGLCGVVFIVFVVSACSAFVLLFIEASCSRA